MKDIPIDNVLPSGATLQDIYVSDSDDLESIGWQLEGHGWQGARPPCRLPAIVEEESRDYH